MAGVSFDHADDAREALRAIVTDSVHGPGALDSSAITANLLQDYLPDAPREAGLLIAAVTAGIPAMLRNHAAESMEVTTAVSLAAAFLAERTAFTSEACEWATAELAIALGLGSADQLATSAQPRLVPELANPLSPTTGSALPAQPTTRDFHHAEMTAPLPFPDSQPARPRTLGFYAGLAAAIMAIAAAGVVTTVLLHGASVGGQPAANSPAGTQTRPPAAKSPPAVASQAVPWTSGRLTITPSSLGAVTIGMTLARASAAAGEPIQEVGDAFGYPDGSTNSGLYVGGIPRVLCLGASLSGYGPTVVTQRGFPLGGTLAQLKATYGTSLAFVPAPATGYFPVPGYVVAYPDGNLAFIVSHGIVTRMEAGPGVRPSSCTG